MPSSTIAHQNTDNTAHGEPILTSAELRLFQELMYREAGIRIPDAKHNLVQGRLRKRLDDLGIASYRAYYEYATASGHQNEFQRLLEALTTNETFFFRHKQHWDFLLQHILPEWQSSASRSANFRVWSAASSTGEEPYSLAIALHSALQNSSFGIHIDATDINTQVLARAKKGIYGAYALQKITPHCLKTYFTSMADGELFQVRNDIKGLVQFRSHNLQEAPASGAAYDLIMLRNVLIYFDAASKQKVLDQLSSRLRSGGYLILGGAETLIDSAKRFEYVRPTIYRKR